MRTLHKALFVAVVFLSATTIGQSASAALVPPGLEFTRDIQFANPVLLNITDNSSVALNLDPLNPPAPPANFLVSGNIAVPLPPQGVSTSTIDAKYDYAGSRIASYIFSGIINKGQGNQQFTCCNFAGGDQLGVIPAAGVNFGPKTFSLNDLLGAFLAAFPAGSFVSARIQNVSGRVVDSYGFSACIATECTFISEPGTLALLPIGLAWIAIPLVSVRRRVKSPAS